MKRLARAAGLRQEGGLLGICMYVIIRFQGPYKCHDKIVPLLVDSRIQGVSLKFRGRL